MKAISELQEEKKIAAKGSSEKKSSKKRKAIEETQVAAKNSKAKKSAKKKKLIEETQVPVNYQKLELAGLKGGINNQKGVTQWFNNLQEIEKAKQDITIENRKNSYQKLTSESRSAMTPEMIKAKKVSMREEKIIERKQRKLDVGLRNDERKRAKQEQDKHDLIQIQEEQKEKDVVDKRVNKLWDRYYKKAFGGKDKQKMGKSISRQRLKQLNYDFPEDTKAKSTPRKKETPEMKQARDEQEQITALMYIPAEKAGRKDDGTRQYATVAYYRGQITDDKGISRVLDLLSEDWVGVNFHPVFLGLTKKAPKRWFPMVLGNPRTEDSPIVPSDLLTTVKVNYKQGKYNQCLFKSLASALHYVGLKDGGRFISQKAPTIDGLDGKTSLVEMKKLMRKGVPQIGDCFSFNTKNGKKKEVCLSIADLVNNLTIYPTVIVLVGNDGSVNHAVTVVDDLIFDSTQAFAMKLTQESLDWISGPLGLKEIGTTYRFNQSHGTKEKLQHILKRHW